MEMRLRCSFAYDWKKLNPIDLLEEDHHVGPSGQLSAAGKISGV